MQRQFYQEFHRIIWWQKQESCLMKKSEIKTEKCWSKKDEKAIISKENQLIMEKWKSYMIDRSVAGARTRNAFLPI